MQQGTDGDQRNGQQKIFQDLGLLAMSLEMLSNFKYICNETFPNTLHEDLHEEWDISHSNMLKSYQFTKYLQQFNKLNVD
ncbi:hypothetical protein TNCV_1050821 [Trichonephila clavipes]|nr:hypothetical protein TNCV_1050821 [Trichonephila clavipes]